MGAYYNVLKVHDHVDKELQESNITDISTV